MMASTETIIITINTSPEEEWVGEIENKVMRENVGGMDGDWGEFIHFWGVVGA